MPASSTSLSVEEGPFPGQGVQLYRRSVRPAGVPRAHLGLLHGYGDHGGRYMACLEWLAERGIACHALDFRGQGRASGRRGYVNPWTRYLDDLESFLALPELSTEGREGKPLFLLGHSHGGLILAAAGIRDRLRGVAGCILSAPFLRNKMPVPPSKVRLARLVDPILPWLHIPTGLQDEWMTADPEMLADSQQDALIVHVATPRWYLGCLAAQEEALLRAGEFRKPLLVLLGEADPVSCPDAVTQFYEGAASADKSLVRLPGFLHELLREKDRRRAFEEILRWIDARAGGVGGAP